MESASETKVLARKNKTKHDTLFQQAESVPHQLITILYSYEDIGEVLVVMEVGEREHRSEF